MKKILTRFVALTLCMGLAVPAFAAEHSITTEYDGIVTVFTVDAVSVETTTLNIFTWEWVTEEVTLVTVAPNTPFSIKNSAGESWGDFFSPYLSGEDKTEYSLVEGNDGMIEDGDTLESALSKSGLSYLLQTSEKTAMFQIGDAYYTIGEGASTTTEPPTPTTPVEPETPVKPETPAPVVPDAPGTYTVKKGDTWSTICTNFYGNNAQRYALMKANDSVKLTAGTVITLPETLGKAVLIPAPVAGEGESLYTVKLGDTLGAIAKATYGDVMQYKAIFERNADRLKDANTIYEGQVIVLPTK